MDRYTLYVNQFGELEQITEKDGPYYLVSDVEKQSKELADYKKYADALKNYLNFLDDDIPSNHDSFDDWTKKAENLREKYNLLSPKGEQ